MSGGQQPIGSGIATLPASQFTSNPAPIIAGQAPAPVARPAASSSSGRLSLAQVVTLCLNHTGDTTRVARAVTVAWLESGFNPAARNTAGNTPPSTDRGLFQINSFWHKEISDAQAYNPVTCTSVAFHLSGGFVNFAQWSSRHYLPGGSSASTSRGQAAARIWASALAEAKAQRAGEKGPSPITAATAAVGGALVDVGGTVGKVVDAALSPAAFLAKLADGHTWLRVIQVVGGVVAVAAGGLILARNTIAQPLGDAAVLAATHHAAAAL